MKRTTIKLCLLAFLLILLYNLFYQTWFGAYSLAACLMISLIISEWIVDSTTAMLNASLAREYNWIKRYYDVSVSIPKKRRKKK